MWILGNTNVEYRIPASPHALSPVIRCGSADVYGFFRKQGVNDPMFGRSIVVFSLRGDVRSEQRVSSKELLDPMFLEKLGDYVYYLSRDDSPDSSVSVCRMDIDASGRLVGSPKVVFELGDSPMEVYGIGAAADHLFMVYYGRTSKSVTCVSLDDGSIRWRHATDRVRHSELSPAAAWLNNRQQLVLLDRKGRLSLFDIKDGFRDIVDLTNLGASQSASKAFRAAGSR
jgi:hypothetical protein